MDAIKSEGLTNNLPKKRVNKLLAREYNYSMETSVKKKYNNIYFESGKHKKTDGNNIKIHHSISKQS